MKMISSTSAKTYAYLIVRKKWNYSSVLICIIFYKGGISIQMSTSCPLSTLDMTNRNTDALPCKGARNLSHSAKTVARV